MVTERIAIDSLSLPAPTTDNALETAIRRLAPFLAARDFRLLRQSLAATARLWHSHERVLRRPSLIDTRQPAPPTRARARHPRGARAGDLALRREMGVVLVSQTHAAARAYLSDGINRTPDLGIHGTKYGREAEVVCGGQLVVPCR